MLTGRGSGGSRLTALRPFLALVALASLAGYALLISEPSGLSDAGGQPPSEKLWGYDLEPFWDSGLRSIKQLFAKETLGILPYFGGEDPDAAAARAVTGQCAGVPPHTHIHTDASSNINAMRLLPVHKADMRGAPAKGERPPDLTP